MIRFRAQLVGAVAIAAGTLTFLTGCLRHEQPGVRDDLLQKAYLDAQAELFGAAGDKDPQTRVRAIRALNASLGAAAGAVFAEALSDETPAVRFAAAIAIGDSRYALARPTLERIAGGGQKESDRCVLCAVVYALHSLGNSNYVGDLGRFLFDTDPQVRSTAALVMGKMGEPSGIGPLQSLAEQEGVEENKIQITASLAMLGEAKSIDALATLARSEALAGNEFLEDRFVAIPALAGVPSPRAAFALRELLSSKYPPHVRVAAAGALARLGEFEQRGYEFCVWAVHDPRQELRKFFGRKRRIAPVEMWSLRRLATMSLGEMKQVETVDMLQELLTSENSGVRVASAMAIMQILASRLSPTPASDVAEANVPR